MNDRKPDIVIDARDGRSADLDAFIDNTALSTFGISRSQAITQGICISCRKAVKNERGEFRPSLFSTDAGRREWAISGLCEKCFDGLFEEDRDD